MRHIGFLLLCLAGLHLYGQPVELLHKKYQVRYFYVDSLFMNFDFKNPGPGLQQVENWEKWAMNNQDPELAAQFKLLECRVRLRKSELWDEVKEKDLVDLAEFAKKNKRKYLEADVLHVLGEYYWNVEKKYVQAVEKYLTAYKLYKDFSTLEFPSKHEFLYDLGLTYFQYDDLENSLKFLRESLHTTPSKKVDINFAVPNTIGLCFRKMKLYDSADWYFKKIYDTALANGQEVWVGIAAGNLGISYFYQGRYDEAEPLLKKDIETGKTGRVKNSAISMGVLASIYFIRNKTDSSEQLLKEALSICYGKRFWPSYSLAEQLYTQLSKVYAVKNNMRMAYLYADSALAAKDSAYTGNNALILAKAQEKSDYLQNQLAAEQLQSQRQIQVFRRNCLVAGFFLLAIIALLAMNRQRLKRTKLEVEKKHAEAELNAASLKLESLREIENQKKLVEDKNKELSRSLKDLEDAQLQLVQAEKMASLGQLTAGIAHEINNPINFVSASIEPLQKDVDDILEVIAMYEAVIGEQSLHAPFAKVEQFKNRINLDLTKKETADLLKGMEQGALRTAEIVKGLKNFSRLDNNTAKMSNLNEGIASTLAILYPVYKNRIKVTREFGELPEINCYPGQLNQVFMNLLSNSIQAITGEGEIFVNTKANVNFVTITIRDTGCGMSRETMSKIYDPFFTTKEVGKGTGLGLSISYGIVQKHKGTIEVFSELNKGTEFVITLPLNQEF